MSTPRDIRLSPGELALKLASAEAVRAAGGQVFVAEEVGRSQGQVSDYCSASTRSFMPLDIARQVEALGAGSPGHPHITRALARAAGGTIGGSPNGCDGLDDLGDHLALVSRENADLVQALAGEDLSACVSTLAPNARARIGREAGELIDRLQRLRSALDSS